MEQTYETRGKIGFIQDQAQAAVLAFAARELTDTEAILDSIHTFLEAWKINGWK